MPNEQRILAINGGSSSIKFALFAVGASARALLSGELQAIGEPSGAFTARDATGTALVDEHLALADHGAAVRRLLAWLRDQEAIGLPNAIGHRLVHGGERFDRPVRLTPEVLAELRALIPLAPQHLPSELLAVEATGRAYPDVPQVACFDTAFHHTMPQVAKQLALPRALWEQGIRRYGFHGLSYEYVMSVLAAEQGGTARGRVIVAHLGNGASMAAICDGQSIETTMGFTPAGGLVMGTRSGDLDPGVLIYLLRERGSSADALDDLINRRSGMLGISALSGDMRELLGSDDPRAAEAVELFCYAARKTIGELSAVLGGADMLIFTGGIGEHAPEIRWRICAGLAFLGIVLDPERNAANATVLSPDHAAVAVRRIPTDEELMIARHTAATLGTEPGTTAGR